jgi:hypothetical protein
MAEITTWEKLKRWFRSEEHRVRVWWNPNPTDEARAKMLAKTLAKVDKETQKRPNTSVRGGTDSGWHKFDGLGSALATLSAWARGEETASEFGRTDLGELGGGLGLNYKNPNACKITTVDTGIKGGKK